MTSISITGLDKVLATLKTLSNGDKIADDAVRITALNSQIDLVKQSMTQSPQMPYFGMNDTAKRWTKPNKTGAARYTVSNDYKSVGGKWAVVNLLNYGHKELTPRNKFFYIPMNRKAAMKAPGAPIPKDFERGTDYILARKIKAVAGRMFIEKNLENAAKELKTRLLEAIKAAIK